MESIDEPILGSPILEAFWTYNRWIAYWNRRKVYQRMWKAKLLQGATRFLHLTIVVDVLHVVLHDYGSEITENNDNYDSELFELGNEGPIKNQSGASKVWEAADHGITSAGATQSGRS